HTAILAIRCRGVCLATGRSYSTLMMRRGNTCARSAIHSVFCVCKESHPVQSNPCGERMKKRMSERRKKAINKHEKWLIKHGLDPRTKPLRQLRGKPFPDLSVKSSAAPTSAFPIEHTEPVQPQKREVFTSNLVVGQSHKQGYMVWLPGIDLP